jgi:hypothetical protein
MITNSSAAKSGPKETVGAGQKEAEWGFEVTRDQRYRSLSTRRLVAFADTGNANGRGL